MMINTREIAEEYRLGHWAQVMQERISSGLSIKAYCRQIGISTNTYHYWQKKLREADWNGTAMVLAVLQAFGKGPFISLRESRWLVGQRVKLLDKQ